MRRLPHDRFVAALRRIRQQIADGLELEHEDSEQFGNKFTHCSWGLCSRNKKQWPDAEDHLWPGEFVQGGRVAPRYRTDTDECPFAGPQESKTSWVGCFCRCQIFQRKLPSQEYALRLYDQRIAEHTRES